MRGLGMACLTVMALAGAVGAAPRIDRHALVARHNVEQTKASDSSPLQVGNGHFAFGADITGLQTFTGFATMADWGWHSSPLPSGQRVEDFRWTVEPTHGRPVPYPLPNPQQPALSQWLAANPHRVNLGRIALALTHADGSPARPEELTDTHQELDLWTGLLTSRFTFDGQPVTVETCCHPDRDLLAVRVTSPLIRAGRLALALAFPYYDGREFSGPSVGAYDRPDAHETTLVAQTKNGARLARHMDDLRYQVALAWSGAAELRGPDREGKHRVVLQPAPADRFEVSAAFAPTLPAGRQPGFAATQAASRSHWQSFWQRGGGIDLSASTDPRWKELERRIVLSQYLLAVNEAGSTPPQESGLVNNGWNGRFHMEMYWWHAAHYALWNRWPELDRSLDVYRRMLASARATAEKQGYAGARWPKCTGPDWREWPHPIHSWLIWQQPHPLFFAELDYRAHPTRATLEKWREVVFATADFMASYAFHEADSDRYVLGPPVYVVSENTDPRITKNPTFETAYWRVGLRLAQQWRKRLGMAPNQEWAKVQAKLAPLPQQEGMYVLYEGVADMWTKWTFEHPALTGVYGILPGDGVDLPTMHRTLDKVLGTWDLNRTWGWDFPMLAMCAARLGEPERAVDLLLTNAPGFQFDERGLATGGPFPYFPSNGGLLYAAALMAAGWDGAPNRPAPGFPEKGWVVRCEGLSRGL